MNFVNLIGHVGQDPTIRTLENGNKVMSFSMATTEKYKVGQETKEKTEWHNIVAWRWLADIPVGKGNKVMVIGKITTRSYEDKEGITRYITEIVATYIEICKKLTRVDEARLPGVDADPFGLRSGDVDGFSVPKAKPEIPTNLTDAPF